MGVYNVPSDFLTEIGQLKKRVDRLERRQRIGNTSVDSGTFTLVNPYNGNAVMLIGLLANGDYGVEFYRDDGTIALRISRILLTDPYQVIRMYNRAGTQIAGE